jgi:hypothetical protein
MRQMRHYLQVFKCVSFTENLTNLTGYEMPTNANFVARKVTNRTQEWYMHVPYYTRMFRGKSKLVH